MTLPLPLKDHLVDPLDPQGLTRSWAEIQSRLDAADTTPGRPGTRFLPLPLWSWAVAAAGLLLVFFWGSLRGTWDERMLGQNGPFAKSPPSEHAESASLLVVGQEEPPRRLTFADESVVELRSGRLQTRRATATEVVLALTGGEAHFDIKKGANRRWTIVTPVADVTVLGTAFLVDSRENSVHVRVERGLVSVKGRGEEPFERMLRAGESLRWEKPESAPAPVVLEDLEESAWEQPADPTAQASRPALSVRNQPTRPAEAESEAPSAADLLAQADSNRAAGQFATAAQLLGQLVAAHPTDPLAPLASFTRGVLQLQELNRASAAASSFRWVIASGAPQALKEDAYGRLFEAYLRLGRVNEARTLSQRYRSAFPQGRHLSTMAHSLGSRAQTSNSKNP